METNSFGYYKISTLVVINFKSVTTHAVRIGVTENNLDPKICVCLDTSIDKVWSVLRHKIWTEKVEPLENNKRVDDAYCCLLMAPH